MKNLLKPSIQLLAIVATSANLQVASAQAPDTLWTKSFGGSSSDRGNAVAETADGGFVLAGLTYSFGAGAGDAWLVRVAPNGDTLWTGTYGTAAGYDVANAVRRTSDGGFVLVGSEFVTTSNVMLTRTDADGTELWTNTFGWFASDSGNDVVQTPDGGFALCGTTRSFHNGFGSSVWLLRTDANGDSLWSHAYGGSSYQDGNAIALTSDDGFIVTGSYNNGGPQSTDVWLLRTDADGDTLWTRTFGEVGSEEGKAVVETSDGGFAVAALTYDGGSITTLIRTDANGDSLWTRSFAASIDGAGSLKQTDDGGFILSASTDTGDITVIRTNASGDVLWSDTVGGGNADDSRAVLQTTDGGYVVAGGTESYGAGQTDAFLIRYVPETSTGSQAAAPPATTFQLRPNYPNPFRSHTTITYAVHSPAHVSIRALDLLGREVRTLVNSYQSAGEYSLNWDGRDETGHTLSGGIYFYRMDAGGVVQTRSMLLVK